MLDEDDLVGGGEYEWAGGRDDRGAAGAGRGEAGDDARLGVRVDGARRLDEQQNLGIQQQGASQDEALALVEDILAGLRRRLFGVALPLARPATRWIAWWSASSVMGCAGSGVNSSRSRPENSCG